MASGAGGGQPSWAQQVHRLAGADEDAARRRPGSRPSRTCSRRPPGASPRRAPRASAERLAARLLDTVVLGAVTAVAAVPLGTKALDHVNEKIDAAKLSGETVTVWLLDGTTAVYLGIVLAVLLVFGVLYEVLPTAKWGRTLGKKLLRSGGAGHRGTRAPVLRRGAAPLARVQRARSARRRCRGRRVVPVRPAVAPVLARQGRAYVRGGLTAYVVRRPADSVLRTAARRMRSRGDRGRLGP